MKKSKIKNFFLQIMGNKNSQIKFQKSTLKEEFDCISSISEKELTYHLSNDNFNDLDRQHMHHFVKRHLFQSNFSVPIEEKLIKEKCKVLDVA